MFANTILFKCLWLIHFAKAFSILPAQQRNAALTRLYQHQQQQQQNAGVRAGTDGYSVLRQPPTNQNWDPNADPEFEIPTTLKENGMTTVSDVDWWSSKQKQQQETLTPTPATPLKTTATAKRQQQQQQQQQQEQAEEFNLFQRTLDTLDFPRVLRALQDHCTTVPARRMVREAVRMTTPTTTVTKAKTLKRVTSLLADTVQGSQERYRAVQEMQWLLQGGHGHVDLNEYTFKTSKGYKESVAGRPAPLGGSSYALEAILEEAHQGRVLEGEEIFEISAMMDSMENVLLWSQALTKVQDIDFVELPKLASGIQLNETLQELLHSAFEKDGKLSGTTFPTVGRLRARIRSLKADIMGRLDTLVALPSIKSKLALESGGPLYSEVSGGRLVIPINPKDASSVGIVHDSSRSGKTVYVEPTEIVGPTNELRQAEGELRAEEARVWRMLTDQILRNRNSLEASADAIGQLDLVHARILLGNQISGTIPIVQDEGIISVRNAKHPVLLLREVENIVGSDVDLGADGNQGLVLTGPNSGGKTVILKLLGLMALLSRGGIPIPVAPAQNDAAGNTLHQPRVDFFNPVLADIGDMQSVGGDLSTFSGHMLVCREVLANSGRNALVLMDELGSGTDPAQGVAIAQALLEALVGSGARVAITTHYMQLKQLAASDDRFSVAGMQFVNGRPTYKLLPGTVGESYALAVAERLELPRAVIARANELLDSETRQMGDLIRELEDQKALVDHQAEELVARKKELEALEEEMKNEKLRLERMQLSARRDEAKKFAKMLEEKEAVLENILEKLKSDPSRRIIAKSWDDIRFVKRDAINEAENLPSIVMRRKQDKAAAQEELIELVPIAELREKPELKEGDTIMVCKQGPLYGREGVITKVLGGRIEVKVNNVNVSMTLSQIALPVKGFKPPTASNVITRPKSISKAAEKALAAERSSRKEDWASSQQAKQNSVVAMRTESNTVDVRGCNLEEAKDKVKEKFSACLMTNRPVVYILHGHGTGGVLKTKIRAWLKSERQLVKRFEPADAADGGDAFTRVELR